MGIQQIIDYVMKTPENTNPAVLRSVIKQNTSSSPSGGGGDLVPFLDGTIETVTIPNEVEALREGTFYNCTLLKAIDVASDHPTYTAVDGVLYTKDGATLVAYPAGKEETEFTLPENVTGIAGGAFTTCNNLGMVIVHEEATNISKNAVVDSENAVIALLLDAAKLNEGGAYPVGLDGVTAVVIPADATYVDLDTFANLSDVDTVYLNGQPEFETITLTDSKGDVTGYTLVFQNGIALKKLIIGDGVTSITSYLANGVKTLESVRIPASVEAVGEYAFSGCIGLKKVILEKGLTYLGSYMFSGCEGIEEVFIPNSITDIGYAVFSSCNRLKNVTLESGLTMIGQNMFGYTPIVSINVPESVTVIRMGAFNYCKSLESIVLPSGLTELGEGVFRGCTALQSVNIPEGVASIEGWLFYNCPALKNIIIPEGVTSIGAYAFCICTGLTSVNIPDSVAEIKYNAFDGCTGLTSVYIRNNAAVIDDRAFLDCSDSLVIHGYTGSTAETYATENGITFEAITE